MLSKKFKQKKLANAVHTVLIATCASPVLAGGDTSRLPGITVEGSNEEGYVARNMDSIKYSQPLVETPRTLIVLPKSVMEDRGADNLQEALRGVAGISLASGEGGSPPGDNMSIRGFSARTDMFIDGIRDLAGYARDMYNVEALEVSKGPGSSVAGRGSVGGSINMVTKKASLDPFTNVKFTQGTESDYRLTLDTNHALGDSTAFRINALSTEGGVAGRDKVDKEMNALAATLSFGLDTPVRWTFAAEYQDQDNLPDYGLPWVFNTKAYSNRSWHPSLANREGKTPSKSLFDNFYGNKDRDYEDIEATVFSTTFERDVSDTGMLQLRYKYSEVERESIVTRPRFSYRTVGSNRIYGPNVSLSSEAKRDAKTEMKAWQGAYKDMFNTAFLSHEYAIGVEYTQENQRTWQRSDSANYGGRSDNLTGPNNQLKKP